MEVVVLELSNNPITSVPLHPLLKLILVMIAIDMGLDTVHQVLQLLWAAPAYYMS